MRSITEVGLPRWTALYIADALPDQCNHDAVMWTKSRTEQEFAGDFTRPINPIELVTRTAQHCARSVRGSFTVTSSIAFIKCGEPHSLIPDNPNKCNFYEKFVGYILSKVITLHV
jgi:hypothetical protein